MSSIIDTSNMSVTIYWRGGPPKELQAAAAGITSDIKVVLRASTYSLEDLRLAADALFSPDAFLAFSKLGVKPDSFTNANDGSGLTMNYTGSQVSTRPQRPLAHPRPPRRQAHQDPHRTAREAA